ncbi:MAG: hypothetical protein ABW098_13335 [Candidatus Thiodiazotropha sp.]
MNKKTLALLIPGIFYTMLTSSTSAVEGTAPGYNQWRPLAEREATAYQDRHPHSPIDGYRQPQPAAFAKHFNWRPMSQLAGNTRSYAIDNRYRFRPMERIERRATPPRLTYRPLQIEIPNNYVYRPLRVNKGAHRVERKTPPKPAVADRTGYGYRNYGAPVQGLPQPYLLPDRYLARHYNYRPPASAARYPGNYARAMGYPVPRGAYLPRYAANQPFNSYRFRPLPRRPDRERYRFRGPQVPRYAVNPYHYPPTYPQLPPAHAYAYRDRPSSIGYPYPGIEQAMQRPTAPNPYGTNWYDGEADGEGAWYKLAGEQVWPRVSHFSPLE